MVSIDVKREEFQQLARMIQSKFGIHLSDSKLAMVMGRLQDVLNQGTFHSLDEYYRYVMADATGKALNGLMDRITTNHTYFLREPAHFTFLREQALPRLVNSIQDRDLRIWSAGCSTGEEPYTLAMTLDSYFGLSKSDWDAKILATDLSERALTTAMASVYASDKILELPPVWQKQYFKQLPDGQSEVVERIKQQVIFRKFNLMESVFPFRRKFHIIFCRNVMFYFDNESRERLIGQYYQWLEPGGYLMIGHAETIGNDRSQFDQVRPSIYLKKSRNG